MIKDDLYVRIEWNYDINNFRCVDINNMNLSFAIENVKEKKQIDDIKSIPLTAKQYSFAIPSNDSFKLIFSYSYPDSLLNDQSINYTTENVVRGRHHIIIKNPDLQRIVFASTASSLLSVLVILVLAGFIVYKYKKKKNDKLTNDYLYLSSQKKALKGNLNSSGKYLYSTDFHVTWGDQGIKLLFSLFNLIFYFLLSIFFTLQLKIIFQ